MPLKLLIVSNNIWTISKFNLVKPYPFHTEFSTIFRQWGFSIILNSLHVLLYCRLQTYIFILASMHLFHYTLILDNIDD